MSTYRTNFLENFDSLVYTIYMMILYNKNNTNELQEYNTILTSENVYDIDSAWHDKLGCQN